MGYFDLNNDGVMDAFETYLEYQSTCNDYGDTPLYYDDEVCEECGCDYEDCECECDDCDY